jgi:predicted permease
MSSGFVRDVRVAFRGLLKTPGVTFVVVLTLAVAIGANTAIFSVVDGVLRSPLPYPDEDRIVRVAATVRATDANSRGDRGNAFSDRGYWHFANNNRSFEKFGGYIPEAVPFPLTGEGAPRQVDVGVMTASAFEVLGVKAELGRLPNAEESTPNGPLVALLSHELWMSQYGSDPAIVGRTVQVNGTSREVIGVMPAGYDFPTPGVELWTPWQLDPASTNFGGHYIFAIARLAPGVTIEAAIVDARSLVARYGELGYGSEWFESTYDGGAVVRPIRDVIVGDVRDALLIVFGTVGFVLLIACGNVANLLLVRADGRRRENAVRMTLGSSRARLARHVLIESALLALVGGVAGVMLAYVGTRALLLMDPAGIPRLAEIEVSGAALAFTAGVVVLTGMLFGVLPALASGSSKTLGALRDGGRSATLGRHGHRTRNALVMAQVALAVVLVIAAGLMVRSFEALRSVDAGFTADNTLTFEVRPLPTKYTDGDALARFYDGLLERIEAVPGVTRAGAINVLPLAGGSFVLTSEIEEFPTPAGEMWPAFQVRRATSGYFEAMGIPLVEGRAFTPDDHNFRLNSVIISRSVKNRYWPNSSALGKRIQVADVSAQVVGVVGDVHHAGLNVPAEQVMYLSMLDAEGVPNAPTAMTVTVRTAVEPLSVVNTLRTAITDFDADVALANVRPMHTVLGDSMSRTTFTASVLTIAGLVALFLGAVGIYGVLSYVVTQRTPEIGIRSALGATPGTVLRMVLAQGMRVAGVGVLIGLVVAMAAGRVIATQLYGVSPFDVVTLVAATAIFLVVAGVASFLPAARAAGTAPVEALRGD